MIREISEHELKEWHDVLETSYMDAYGNQERGRSIAYEDLLAEYKSGHMFFVSLKDDTFIGVLRLMRRDDHYQIKDIAVLPEYKHKGYGKELIEFAKTKAKELGANKISLGFFDDNLPLRKWYEKQSFSSVTTFSFDNSTDPSHMIRVMECMI